MSTATSPSSKPMASIPKQYGSIYGFVLVLALYGLIQYGVMRFLHEDDFFQNQPSWILVIELFGGLFASIAVHELGHVLAGRLVGMHILSFSVWPFRITHVRRGWSFKVSMSIKAPLGQGAMLPDGVTNLRQRFLIHHIGGPLVGFVTSIAAAWLVMAHAGSLNPITDGFLCRYVTFGLWLNLVSFVPGIPMTDGYGIKMLLNKGPIGEKFAAYFACAAQIAYGMHYDEMDASLLEKISQPAEIGLFERYSLYHAYYWTLSNRKYDDARALLEKYLQLTTQPAYADVRPLIALEKIYFDGRYGYSSDSELAGMKELDVIPPAGTVEPFIASALRSRAEAALQFGRHHFSDAKLAAEKGLEQTAMLEADDTNLSRIVLHDLNELRDLSASA